MIDPKDCRHRNFAASVNVIRLEDVGEFRADVHVECTECKTPFRFVGLPPGYRGATPTTSVEGLQASMPIAPGPYSLDEMLERAKGGIRYEVPPTPPADGERH